MLYIIVVFFSLQLVGNPRQPDLELHDRFCDDATWKNDPGRTNNFLEKKKLFENCFLSMVLAPICIYRNLLTSIYYKDTGSELFGFTVYSIGKENSFCFKKRVFLSLEREKKKKEKCRKIKFPAFLLHFLLCRVDPRPTGPTYLPPPGALEKKSREKNRGKKIGKKIGKKS